MEIDGIVCFNGEFMPADEARVSFKDSVFLYGMGLFETIRVVEEEPRLVDIHLARLLASAHRLGLPVHWKADRIADMLAGTARENRIASGGLRLTVTAGGNGCPQTVLVHKRQLPYDQEKYRTGIRAGFSSSRKNSRSPLSGHKTTCYFENILARREASSAGWDEAIFMDYPGNIAEGSASNIFIVSGEDLVTPSEDCGLLLGITRSRVIETCRKLGISCTERHIKPGEMLDAGECFATSSLAGVVPVTRIGYMVIGDGLPGPLTHIFMNELKN